ncbi:siphovirus Gp157 family protein [Pseudoramibacter sp. HA2172]|uniref:siphovirus Gp157 family protein n=1 Tax=Pseudoramibacter faecis TaxID=3108534 RepID=UPI002E79EF26|nr:siphovirus Gp157 family protein [Pseudoramibacter sp. HA2172]
MKLYEINEEILRLTDQIEVDEETGEILCDIDSIEQQIDSLQMERHSILTYLAKLVLNLRSESASLKAEEQRLKARRDRLLKKEEKLMHILDRECAGEKTDLGIATFSYRKTSHVDVSDAAKAFRWLRRNKHPDCYRIPEPEIAKAEVKKLIKAGTKVPGCAVVDDYSCQLK